MKALVPFLALALLVVGPFGCGKKDKDKDDDDEKGAIETTVEYVTGHTAIKAKSKAQQTLIKAVITNGISMFEVENGRSPISLEELVAAGYLDKTYLDDEYGKPLEVEARDGQLIVRSVRIDKETRERIVNWEQTF